MRETDAESNSAEQGMSGDLLSSRDAKRGLHSATIKQHSQPLDAFLCFDVSCSSHVDLVPVSLHHCVGRSDLRCRQADRLAE